MAKMLLILAFVVATVTFSSVTCNVQPRQILTSSKVTYIKDAEPIYRSRGKRDMLTNMEIQQVLDAINVVRHRQGSSGSIHRGKRDVLNSAEIQQALYAHNTARRGEYSSNMNELTYNDYLASLALQWAQGCYWQHGQPPHDTSTAPYDPVGQNLYAVANGVLDIISAILTSWCNSERPYFNYDTLDCQTGQQCGHYTQAVWATSRQIGCAYSFCPTLFLSNMTNATYFVCNYGPAGNYQGVKPFLKGPACSACQSGSFWCNNGLCAQNCPTSSPNCSCQTKYCYNGATPNNNACSCQCANGYYGNDCSCRSTCYNGGTLNSDCTCYCAPGYCNSDCSRLCSSPSASKKLAPLSTQILYSLGIIPLILHNF